MTFFPLSLTALAILAIAALAAGSKASSNGSQYTCRRVDDGYGLLSLALPQWIFCALIG